MPTVNIYLTFNGNCRKAFDYYKSVFGGEYQFIGTFADMPPQEGMPPLSEADKDKIMHVSLPISNETTLMGSDSFGNDATVGNNFSISVLANSREEADRLFTALADGGTVNMPMNETFWGSYFGMATDQFGINWMMNMDLNASK